MEHTAEKDAHLARYEQYAVWDNETQRMGFTLARSQEEAERIILGATSAGPREGAAG